MTDLTTRTVKRMGWRPDLPDYRDHIFEEKHSLSASAPVEPRPVRKTVTGFTQQVPVFDQDYLGSCVANCISSMMSFTRKVTPRSRLQIYYEARRLIDETHIDAGAYIRDGIKVIANLGAGRESWWPYEPSKFDIDPPLTVDRDALLRKIFSYSRLLTRQDFERCLTEDHPFVIGFTVYDGFLTSKMAKTGVLNLPTTTERQRGGHAVCVYGYDNDFRNSDFAKAAQAAGEANIPERAYIIRNSWGERWGRKGDFAIDARYLENPMLAGDAWTIRNTKNSS